MKPIQSLPVLELQVTCEGRRCLGAALGQPTFVAQFVSSKVDE